MIRGCLVSCFRGCLFGSMWLPRKNTTTVGGGGGLDCVCGFGLCLDLIVARVVGVWICVVCVWLGFGSD